MITESTSPTAGTSEHRTEQVGTVLGQIEQLPTLSPVAARVMTLASASEEHFDEIVSLIEADPSLSARLLALCKRASTGIARPITTVKRAAAMLGVEAVQSAVLSVQVYEILGRDAHATETRDEHAAGGFDGPGFWRHALAVASCAELLAEEHPALRVRPEEAFCAGLVHDLGKLALDWVLPRTYRKVVELAEARQTDLAPLERTIIGLDHHVAGKRLAERWGLPAQLRDAMWLHAQPAEAVPESAHKVLIGIVSVADALVRRLHLGWSGSCGQPGSVKELCRAWGLDAERAEAIAPRLHEALAGRCKDLRLEGATPGQLVAQSLSAANARLSRLYELNRQRSDAARGQGRVLEVLSVFHQEIVACVGVGSALACVARSARALGGCSLVAALHQTAPGEPWRLYDLAQDTEHPRSIALDPPRGEQGPMDLHTLDAGGSLGGALGLLSWLGEHLCALENTPDMRGVRTIVLPTPGAGGCVLLHDGDLSELALGRASLACVRSAWGGCVLAGAHQDESRALTETLAQTARQLSETRDELARGRSMARLGELTAGAAHELNNPLAVISARGQMLASRLKDERDRLDARAVTDAAARLTDVITNLHLVARPGNARPRETDLGKLLGDTIDAAQEKLERLRRKTTARVTLSVSSVAARVNADADMLQRSVLELLTNALESGSTNVGISAKSGDADASLVISVHDDGPGLSAHAQEHAFDPFFSEKPAGRQPGLGLPVARALVTAMGGELRLSCAPGQGTTAVIRLPVWKLPGAGATPAVANPNWSRTARTGSTRPPR